MDTLKQYKIEVTYKDGRFNLYVPDLCLVASDGDLGKAYEIAAQHVDVLKARYIEAGIEDKFPKPDVVRKLPGLDSSLIRFGIRGAICAGVILAIVGGSAFTLRQATPRISSSHIASAIHRLATRIDALPPESRARLHNDLRIIGKEVGVFTKALSEPTK
jgi:hypothetical protein